jgi:hypothetical protein
MSPDANSSNRLISLGIEAHFVGMPGLETDDSAKSAIASKMSRATTVSIDIVSWRQGLSGDWIRTDDHKVS